MLVATLDSRVHHFPSTLNGQHAYEVWRHSIADLQI